MKFGFAEDMNRKFRRTMEDAHSFATDFITPGQGFFAVFDGHAGKNAADWCGDNFQDLFKKNFEKHIVNAPNNRPKKSVAEILDMTFVETDSHLGDKQGIHSGCTAVVAFIQCLPDNPSDRILHVANAGDARAVYSRGGKAIRMSYDHKGSDSQEIKRIIESGGFIMNSRVNGVLAVTRSLGDMTMKDLITSRPYTSETVLTSEQDDFLILACDGIWDVTEDQTAVDLIKDIKEPQQAADFLLKYALENQCTDNISCMVIRL